MINTVANFLEEFKSKSLEIIEKKEKNISHRPTIGNIYEGLTAEILNKSIFKDLNVRIVLNSFIFNDSGKISNEMDCMVVCGEGEKISFTDQYKYHIRDVIAVIQVKKKLTPDEIDKSHNNLRNVIDTAEPRDGEKYMGKIHRHAFKALVGKDLPYPDQVESLTDSEKIIYHFLRLQAFWPLRISLSYYGYKSEFGLREAFVNNIEGKLLKPGGKPVKGYGPISFPDIIISGNNTIVKNIGMPFGIPFFKQDFYWMLFCSWHSNPSYFLLELIWTRLSYKFNISSQIFGEDFQLDPIHPLLWAKDRKIDEKRWGWEYSYHAISRRRLNIKFDPKPWKPVEINMAEWVILMRIISDGYMELDQELEDFLQSKKYSTQQLIDHLTINRVLYVEDNKIYLLLEEPMIQSGKDDKTYIGENANGEMYNWIGKKK